MDEAVTREIAAYQAMHAELWRVYHGRRVAVYQEKLVDHDADGVALSLRIDGNYNGFAPPRRLL